MQHYAWGDYTFIPDLLGEPPDGRPWAELWLGTHPHGPATLTDGRPLSAVTGTLPYLLKVLAVAEPLSLQLHPSRAQAQAGFAAGRYPDPEPKPELLCALTPFEAFCGIRPVDATLDLLDELGADDLAGTLARRRGSCNACCAVSRRDALRPDHRRCRIERPPGGGVGLPPRQSLPGRSERRGDAAAQLRPPGTR